jgi:hypothetical protein
MKFPPLIFAATIALPCYGETVYTVPQGYTKISIEEAPSLGTSSLTALSVTLLQDLTFAGSVNVGAFSDNSPASDTQAASVSSVTWTADQWTATPHLAYLTVADDPGNADGIAPAEEAFLISANTTNGGLTLVTESGDLLSNFPASTTIEIRKANTLSSLLSSVTGSLHTDDRVYLWNQTDNRWDTFRFLVGPNFWINTTTNVPSNDMIVFPEEGMFIERTQTTPADLQLTLFGEVPAVPQISSIEGSGFMSCRAPINSTLADLGVEDSNWNATDRVYIWNPSASPQAWETHRFVVGPNFWINTGTNSPSNTRVISANTAVFVGRDAPTTSGNGGITTNLPYTIE